MGIPKEEKEGAMHSGQLKKDKSVNRSGTGAGSHKNIPDDPGKHLGGNIQGR